MKLLRLRSSLSYAFPSAKSRLILIHVPCQNSLALLFYAVFINKWDTLQKRNFHVFANLYTILLFTFIQISRLYCTRNLIICLRSFTLLSLECWMTEKWKEMWSEGKNYKITFNLVYNLLLLTSVLFCVYVCSCRV